MATLNYIIGASSDDARQAGTAMTLTTTAIIVSGGTNFAGVRFTGVALAATDTVTAATLSVEVTSGTYDDPAGLVWKGELATNPGTFTTAASNISGRSTTTASTTWSGTGIGAGDHAIDVTSIVQELIAQGGWASGNAMAFLGDGVGATELRFTSYDGSTTTCARLSITYTPAAQTLTGATIASTGARYAGVVSHLAPPQTLTGAAIASGTTLYAGTVTPGTRTLTGATIASTTAVYAGHLVNYRYFVGAVIAPTTVLYGGALVSHSYLIGVFIGMENPIAISGPAFINIAALYAGMLALRIAAATAHVASTQVFTGTVTTGPRVQTGRFYAGQVFHA